MRYYGKQYLIDFYCSRFKLSWRMVSIWWQLLSPLQRKAYLGWSKNCLRKPWSINIHILFDWKYFLYLYQASLATAETQEVQHFILSLLRESEYRGKDIWLGGKRRCPSACDEWEWEDLNTQWNYTNWDTNEPNSLKEECLFIRYTVGSSPFESVYKWHDVSCSRNLNYICKKN